jgi:para-nitrobenzyl esterase
MTRFHSRADVLAGHTRCKRDGTDPVPGGRRLFRRGLDLRVNRVAVALLCFVLTSIAAVRATGEIKCGGPLQTNLGKVVGSDEAGVCSWKGIPFAAPPVGDLRWKAPQPHPGWPGVRDAVEYGPICIQDGAGASVLAGSDAVMLEDCLFLNVWSPARSEKFPVMFWIHGGGYAGGSGSTFLYNGARLAEFGDVVVVTINYRLGPFGFLAHPELKEEDPHGGVGGYGILDMVAALEWVRDNIENFGGDPSNVTIFGCSAGAWAVCNLMATPLANGLFHKAIMESQGCEAVATLEQGYEQAAEISKALGCGTDDVGCLREAPAKELLKAATETVEGRFNILPNPDGHLMTDTPLAMIQAGNYNRVPLLAGHNRNEADVLTYFTPKLYGKSAKDYPDIRVRSIPLTDEEAIELTGLYPLSQYGSRVKKAYGQILSDAMISCPTYSAVAAVASHQEEVYYYRFDYDEYNLGGRIGSAHGMEMPFVFGTLVSEPANQMYGRKKMPDALTLSENIQSYWVNFAKTGNPNGSGLPNWPAFSNDRPARLILDTQIRSDVPDYVKKCEFWETYNQNNTFPARNLGKKEK